MVSHNQQVKVPCGTLKLLDLHHTCKCSLYPNIMPDFGPTFLADAKIKDYASLMQQKYILHWQHTIQYIHFLVIYTLQGS